MSLCSIGLKHTIVQIKLIGNSNTKTYFNRFVSIQIFTCMLLLVGTMPEKFIHNSKKGGISRLA